MAHRTNFRQAELTLTIFCEMAYAALQSAARHVLSRVYTLEVPIQAAVDAEKHECPRVDVRRLELLSWVNQGL